MLVQLPVCPIRRFLSQAVAGLGFAMPCTITCRGFRPFLTCARFPCLVQIDDIAHEGRPCHFLQQIDYQPNGARENNSRRVTALRKRQE